MQAVILAGGKGTRLRPYTLVFPKPLMPIGDYPILEIVIRQLAKSGFNDVTIAVGHLKELLQASNRRGTYLARTALAAVLALCAVPMIKLFPRAAGFDWRAISDVMRPVFVNLTGIVLIALSLMGAVTSWSAIQTEWTNHTIEVLRTTALTFAAIIVGKLAAVCAGVLMFGLALLPMMTVGFALSGLPLRAALLGSAVMAASVFMFSALGMSAAATWEENRKGGWDVALTPAAVYILIFSVVIITRGVIPLPMPAVFVAAFPPVAVRHVAQAAGYGGMAPLPFALLSIAMPLLIGGIALSVSPWFLRRAFGRAEGHAEPQVKAGRPRRRSRRIARPPLTDEHDPVAWLDLGRHTRMIPLTCLLIFALMVA